QGDASSALSILQDGQRHLDRYQLKGANTCALVMAFAEARLLLAEMSSGSARDQALAEAGHACDRALVHGLAYPIALAVTWRSQAHSAGKVRMCGCAVVPLLRARRGIAVSRPHAHWNLSWTKASRCWKLAAVSRMMSACVKQPSYWSRSAPRLMRSERRYCG